MAKVVFDPAYPVPQMDAKRLGIGGLLFGAVLGASQLTVIPAYADEEQLQRQFDAMKRQLEIMQRELAQTKKQSAQQRASAAPQPASAAPSQVVAARGGNENVIPPAQPLAGAAMPTKTLPSWFDGIHVSMAGSFVELEGAWRQHSEVSDGATDPPFANPGIPLQNSALSSEREFRASAQQSRLALKVNGDIDPNQHLKAYYEMDFLGASTDANGLQYEYVRLRAFPGVPTGPGTPNAGLMPNNNIAFLSLRYYPFN